MSNKVLENKSKLYKILFVINTYKGKSILLDIPEVDKISNHKTPSTPIFQRASLTHDQSFNDVIIKPLKSEKSEKGEKDQKDDDEVVDLNDILSEIFSLKNITKNQHILDIQIGEFRYIADCINFIYLDV